MAQAAVSSASHVQKAPKRCDVNRVAQQWPITGYTEMCHVLCIGFADDSDGIFGNKSGSSASSGSNATGKSEGTDSAFGSGGVSCLYLFVSVIHPWTRPDLVAISWDSPVLQPASSSCFWGLCLSRIMLHEAGGLMQQLTGINPPASCSIIVDRHILCSAPSFFKLESCVLTVHTQH